MAQSIGFVPVPYYRTLKAIAYSGRRLEDVRRVLEQARLEYPKESVDPTVKRLHLSLRAEARKLTKETFDFSDEECIEHGIDAMYHYLKFGGARGKHPKCDFVCKILIDCRDLLLRKMIDTLLYVGEFDPEMIQRRIYENSVVPTTVWGVEEIGFYRDYFWDSTIMTNADWQRYRSWAREGQFKLAHVRHFNPSNERSELLLNAQLSVGLSDSAMLSRAKDIIYIMLTKAERAKDSAQASKLTAALNRIVVTSSRDLGEQEGRRKLESAIERITTPLDGSVGKIPLKSRDDLPEGSEIGDRATTEQLDIVLNGQYDIEAKSQEEEDDGNVIVSP